MKSSSLNIAQQGREVRPHVDHLVEHQQLVGLENGAQQVRPVAQPRQRNRLIQLAPGLPPAGVAGAEDAPVRAAHAGDERTRAGGDREGVLPAPVAEAAREKAVEVADVDAVEEIERLQRITAARAGVAQHLAGAAQRRQILRVGEEALAGILQNRVELGILPQHVLGVVVHVVLAADVAVAEQQRGARIARPQRRDQRPRFRVRRFDAQEDRRAEHDDVIGRLRQAGDEIAVRDAEDMAARGARMATRGG